MRFFFQFCPIFALIPTIAFHADDVCGCGNPQCAGGWTIFLTWAGFEAGVSFSRKPKAPQP